MLLETEVSRQRRELGMPSFQGAWNAFVSGFTILAHPEDPFSTPAFPPSSFISLAMMRVYAMTKINASSDQPKARPAFRYSFVRPLIGYSIMLGIVLLVAAGYILSGAIIGSIVFLILAALLLGPALRLIIGPVRRAWFYEDYFEVSGVRLESKRKYSDIEKVTKLKVLPLVSPRTQVEIYIQGESRLVVPANPTSKKLQADLCSWLSKKIAERPS